MNYLLNLIFLDCSRLAFLLDLGSLNSKAGSAVLDISIPRSFFTSFIILEKPSSNYLSLRVYSGTWINITRLS